MVVDAVTGEPVSAVTAKLLSLFCGKIQGKAPSRVAEGGSGLAMQPEQLGFSGGFPWSGEQGNPAPEQGNRSGQQGSSMAFGCLRVSGRIGLPARPNPFPCASLRPRPTRGIGRV